MDLRRLHSICYMSLADAFLTRLRQEAESRSKSRMVKGMLVEVLPVEGDRQDFIYTYLTRLYEGRQGTFSKPKIFSRQTIYECERSSLCKGSSSGDPTKTRANGCSAYVSFLFEEGATITACVVRSRLVHTGHDPTNREESRVSRIDLSLRFMIETQLGAGMRVSEVMSEVGRWNKSRGYTDHHNRRFFPTRQDVQQIAMTLRRPPRALHPGHAPQRKLRKYDTLGRDSAARVLRSELREWCVFHQSCTTASPAPRPLIVVLQNRAMREAAQRWGKDVLFVDKNYEGLRQYGCAVYVLGVCDQEGGAHPGAYILTSDDEPMTFLHALRELLALCPLTPRCVLLDRELQSFSEVLVTLLPDTLFLVPWFQVAQEVHRWLAQLPQVSGRESAGVRRMLLQCLQELKDCGTKEAFVEAVSGLEGRAELEGFTSTLLAGWLSCPARWCDYGRAGVCESPAQSAVWERFFLRLQHQLLKGLHTRRTLPDLLRLITEGMTQLKNAAEGLLEVSLLLEGSAVEHAAALIKQGWPQLVIWQGDWVAHVPCHTLLETSYRVTLPTMECECPALTLAGPCVHLCLVSTLAQLREGPPPQQERQRLAEVALQQGDYLLEGNCCITFHSGGMCVTELASGMCTCVAASLGTACVGVLLLGLAREAGQDQPHTSATLTTLPLPKVEPPAPQKPHIIIQTHTGLPDPRETLLKDLEAIEEGHDSLTGSVLSSQALLEKLYHWSTSKDFTDSEVLHSLLQAAHDTVWGSPGPPASSPTPSQPSLGKGWGNKKLRAVVRPIRRKDVTLKEEEEEEEGASWAPPTKVTRSGRRVRGKEEPDFVT